MVRDKNAKIVRDLKPGEVQVFEDGVPQPLRHFELYDGRTETQTPAAPATAAPTSARSATTAATGDTAQAAPMTMNEVRDMSVVTVPPAEATMLAQGFGLSARRELKVRVHP